MSAPLSSLRAVVLLVVGVSLLGGCATHAGVRTESSRDRLRSRGTPESFPAAPPSARVSGTTLNREPPGGMRDLAVFVPGAPPFVGWTPGPLLRVDPPTESLLGLR